MIGHVKRCPWRFTVEPGFDTTPWLIVVVTFVDELVTIANSCRIETELTLFVELLRLIIEIESKIVTSAFFSS